MIEDIIRKIVKEELDIAVEKIKKEIKGVPTSQQYDDVLKPRDIAKIMKIGITSAYEICRNPNFPAIRIGNRIVVSRDKFFEWLRENEDDIQSSWIESKNS